MIQKNVLPRLFLRKTKNLSNIVGYLSIALIKMVGLGLLNPVTSEKEKCLSFQRESTELIQAVTGVRALSNADHPQTLGEERRDGDK